MRIGFVRFSEFLLPSLPPLIRSFRVVLEFLLSFLDVEVMMHCFTLAFTADSFISAFVETVS